MCSYIGFTVDQDKISQIYNSDTSYNKFEKSIEYALDKKGSSKFYKCMILKDSFIKTHKNIDICSLISCAFEDLYNSDNWSEASLLFFNRMEPEMEKEGMLVQPYYNEDFRSLVAVHGTIPEAETIKNVQIDTDIFATGRFEDNIISVEQKGGKISAIEIDWYEDGEIIEHNIKTYHNGLGCYNNLLRFNNFTLNMISNIDISSVSDRIRSEERENCEINNYFDDSTILISLFSGGLDITCSTYQAIVDTGFSNLKEINLWYFDWNTNASKYEIEAGKKFKDILLKETGLGEDKINHEVFKVDKMFKNILKVCDTDVRLNDKKAKGKGKKEAEGDMSYVPFRNTFLLTLAAAKAEQLYPNKKVVFVAGLNLSESLAILDNSSEFLKYMNSLVKVGGQKTFRYEVIAPFVNKTKTEMLKSFVVEDSNFGLGFNIDLSSVFSCYFPNEDGTECGKCGSCLLKEKALDRALSR